ncbi:MAG: hypothetical protein MJ094_04170 [Saccharofermentans sp.]|nr:hypothetical protein [Saccharofermentans sp.]
MNSFYGMEKLLGLKIMRLEDELSRIPDIKKWNTKNGIVYKDSTRKMRRATSKLGTQMAIEYEHRKQLITEIQELRGYWKEIHNSEFNRKTFHYKPKPADRTLERMFGRFEDMVEEPNTFENKKHHWVEDKDLDSKTEADITRICNSLHIKQKVHVRIVFPDGFIWVVDSVMYIEECGTMIFHEHFGRTGDENYDDKTLTKMRHVFRHGLMPGKHFLFTYEGYNHPSSVEQLQRDIKSIILGVL